MRDGAEDRGYEKILASGGERRLMDRPGYREYVQRTSGFFPLPPRSRA